MIAQMNVPTPENGRHRQQIIEGGQAYQRVDEFAGPCHVSEGQGHRIHAEKTHPSPAYRAYDQQRIRLLYQSISNPYRSSLNSF